MNSSVKIRILRKHSTFGGNIDANTYIEVLVENRYVYRCCSYTFVDGIMVTATDYSTLKALKGDFTEDQINDNFSRSLDLYVEKVCSMYNLEDVEFEGYSITDNPGVVGLWRYTPDCYIQIVSYADPDKSFGNIFLTQMDTSLIQ